VGAEGGAAWSEGEGRSSGPHESAEAGATAGDDFASPAAAAAAAAAAAGGVLGGPAVAAAGAVGAARRGFGRQVFGVAHGGAEVASPGANAYET